MEKVRLKQSRRRMFASHQNRACVLAGVFVILCASSRPAVSVCTEKPTVWMDESTAGTHLIASRKFVFTRKITELVQIQQVVLAVTVDRKGTICEAKAIAGPGKLRQAAEKVVKNHWRFRPFLVDWKPVVVQFPVTVNFVLSAGGKDAMLLARTEPLRRDYRGLPKFDRG